MLEVQTNSTKVHQILAHSYLINFLFFIIGLVLNFWRPIHIWREDEMAIIGLVLILLATLLIFWAQNTSRSLDKSNISKESFCRGPYCYTRSPTHWGIFFLMFGFGIMINSFFVAMATAVSFFITRISFVRRQEQLLAQKYGNPYIEYKKSVRF